MADKNIYIKNKKASFNYETIQTYTAGIVLTGTEIKSVRDGKAKKWNYKSRQTNKINLNFKPV